MAQLLSILPIGAKVKFGKYSVNGEVAQDITWVVVAKDHISTPAYPTNSVTLMTEKIIDLRCFDANEPSSSGRGVNGSGRYDLSNIRQWLNSDKGAEQWYVAQHTYDRPPTESNTINDTHYDNRPGFLNAFSDDEKNAILNTTIRMGDHFEGLLDFTDKVFLPSLTEVHNFYGGTENAEGAQYPYFANNPTLTYITDQAYSYTLCKSKPVALKMNHPWWSRTGSYDVNDRDDIVYALAPAASGGGMGFEPYDGSVGVRPVLNLSSNIFISDTADAEGCYSVTFNVAPTAPSIINVPTIYGGKNNSISWGVATDLDGDTLTYQLECSMDGGDYTEIYNGATIVYAHLVPFGTSTVTYRVKATDPSGESSAYTNSNTFTVVNNNAPVISGADSNLGVKGEGFTGTYVVTDANNNTVTVTEAIDGVQIRALVATLGETITYGVKGDTWLALPNGSHTLTIRATDGIDTTVRTYVFTKLVDGFTIQNSTPWATSTMPTRIMIVVTRNIPSAATFKVEVCNNGFDTYPEWEDATDAVKSGLVHVFENEDSSSGKWGVLIRVTVERNGATGACYVSAIGGNFE